RNMCHNLLYKHIPLYAREYKVISYDNRGVGKSDKPDIPYSLEMMARDCAGLLDVIGVTKAHFMGYSMGARIVEEMALSYPERIISLVLACPITWSAELHNQRQPPNEAEKEEEKQWNALPEDERVRLWLASVFTGDFYKNNPKLMQKLAKIIKTGYGPPYAQDWHAHASNTYDNYQRLSQIKVPTIIIAGGADRTVTLDNIRLLQEKLPDAELVIMEKMPHLLMWEGFDEFNRIMLEFLRRHSG
ncbi:MAG: alpha/beta hydrolase, partial [Dehalococcoidales bacterium]